MKKIIPQSIKNAYHLVQAIVANVWHGFPSRKIRVIGVTGTNGKTTTCQMIAKILEEAGYKVALASTINFKLAEYEWVNKTKFTTVSAFATQKFVAQAVKVGCKYLVLETSSHSLDQGRVWGVEYAVAVITNVTREHLDYHKTMERYRLAKLKLFKSGSLKTAVVNLDMEKPLEYFSGQAEKYYGYTLKEYKRELEKVVGEEKIRLVAAENIAEDISGSTFQIKGTKFSLHLPGKFNIENALAATCVGLSEGIDLVSMADALKKIHRVAGRMDEVKNTRGVKIIIDYALTPDSMEKLGALISGQKKPGERLIWVLGACGERDRGKRPLMGEIVSRYADFILVTNEDPYGEDPVRIINEVFSGVVGKTISNSEFLMPKEISVTNYQLPNTKIEGKNCWRILDRRMAIRSALKLAKTGDIILVTGKGAEETMAIGKKRIPWNERGVVEEELAKLD